MAPLLDMIRYHKFDRAFVWKDEYGVADKPDEFETLISYSPYHHVRSGVNYPAVMFVTGDQDTRCNPAHVRKMAARLQDEGSQTNPILVDYQAMRGHSPTMPLSMSSKHLP